MCSRMEKFFGIKRPLSKSDMFNRVAPSESPQNAEYFLDLGWARVEGMRVWSGSPRLKADVDSSQWGEEAAAERRAVTQRARVHVYMCVALFVLVLHDWDVRFDVWGIWFYVSTQSQASAGEAKSSSFPGSCDGSCLSLHDKRAFWLTIWEKINRKRGKDLDVFGKSHWCRSNPWVF